MVISVILVLVFSVLSCSAFNVESFLKNNCPQTDLKYYDNQESVNIDLLCQNFKFTFEEIQDIQNREFIISNKTSIYIENANIGIVNEKFFQKFPNALEMILRDVEMKLEKTTDSSQHTASTLKTLRLQHCQLHENKGTTLFKSLPSLDMVEIRSTTFDNKDIDDDFLEGSPKLKKVSITNSDISNIGKDVFRKLSSLRYLDLSNLGLTGESLSSYALVNNNNLEFLDISSNALKEILTLPGSLKFVNVSNNQIANISKSDFQNLQLLEEIYLDDNNLKGIPQDSFESLKNLETISLAANQIRSISEETFKNLPKLQSLNLQWNSIERLPSGLDRIKDLMFEPQKDAKTTTTTTTEETSSSSSTSTPKTTSSSSTDTPQTSSTTLSPAVGSAQASSVMNLILLSLFGFLSFVL